MALENRNLEIGTRLVANYKKQAYVCTVEAAAEGDGIEFVLATGERFKSPSAAGSKVMGGGAVNGWRFWSLDGSASVPEATTVVDLPKAKAAPKGKKKLIYRVPNQLGTPEGKIKFFCPGCMKGFLVEAGVTPQACPEGHTEAALAAFASGEAHDATGTEEDASTD